MARATRGSRLGEDWFCIAGLWRESPKGPAWTMLTVEPGPDVAPYHNRQVAIVPHQRWAGWLDYSLAAGEVLAPSAAYALRVEWG